MFRLGILMYISDKERHWTHAASKIKEEEMKANIEDKDFLQSHQPNYKNVIKIGKGDDYIFQALAHMGNASHHMSWANTVVAALTEVQEELKTKMKHINQSVHELQELLREIK